MPPILRSHGIMPISYEIRDIQNDLIPMETGPSPVIAITGRADVDYIIFTFLCAHTEEGSLIVWTDGACTDQQHPTLRRAGYGVWFADNHPWNISAKLRTFTQTSPRAEARAILNAIERARGPILIVSDNEAAVNYFNDLVYNVKQQIPVNSRAIANASNGDIWSRIYNAITLLRHFNVNAKWVKGHTKLKDVENNIISMQDHLGNCKADGLATTGASAHAILPSIKNGFLYRKFLTMVVQKFMVRSLSARQATRRELELADMEEGTARPEPVPTPTTQKDGEEPAQGSANIPDEVVLKQDTVANLKNNFKGLILGQFWMGPPPNLLSDLSLWNSSATKIRS